jgi:TusA-related sulfurtransferase
MNDLTPKQTLDLRTTKCPLNFVKTKLALEKLAIGDILEIWILTEGESAINIPKSIAQEGHEICHTRQEPEGLQKLFIRKAC